MDISIIVPVFNSASYVSRCLEALESQDYPRDRYEIIAVDNNSTDGSDSIVMGYPSVKLLREAKQGSYAAVCGKPSAR
jgi:glycosyltransferase involved in cell wall biosynthesis